MGVGPEDVWISVDKAKRRKLNRDDREPFVFAAEFCGPTRCLCVVRLPCVATGRPATDVASLYATEV